MTVGIVDELLTEAEVVRRVPGRDSDVREWLRSLAIARQGPTGLRLYRWSEVLAHLPLERPVEAPPPARATLRRSSRVG